MYIIDETYLKIFNGDKVATFNSYQELLGFLKKVPIKILLTEFNNTGNANEWGITGLLLSLVPELKEDFNYFVQETPDSYRDEWHGVIDPPQEDDNIIICGLSATLSRNHWGGGYCLTVN